jgi:hypothetical protein
MNTKLHKLRKFTWLVRAKVGIITSGTISVTAIFSAIYTQQYSIEKLTILTAIFLISAESISYFKKQLEILKSDSNNELNMTLFFQKNDNPTVIRWVLLIACTGLLVWQLTLQSQ